MKKFFNMVIVACSFSVVVCFSAYALQYWEHVCMNESHGFPDSKGVTWKGGNSYQEIDQCRKAAKGHDKRYHSGKSSSRCREYP